MPLLKRNQPPATLNSELKRARKAAFRTSFLVLFLVSGIVPALCLAWNLGPEQSLADKLRPVGSVILHTYPLTLAIALITFSRRQKWFRWGKWFFAATVIIVSAQLGNVVGELSGLGAVHSANVFGQYSNPVFSIPAEGINQFIGFYQHYGARAFLASLLIGSFAGATASRLMPHLPKKLDSDSVASLARELDELRKDAA